jgi:hypothetical protein
MEPISSEAPTNSGDVRSMPAKSWISSLHFSSLMQGFRTNPSDPETLLIAGSLKADGTSSIDQVYRTLNGRLGTNGTGNLSVQLLDIAGSVLAEMPFQSDISVDDVPPSNLLTAVPFAVEMPYVSGVASIQLVQGGKVVARVLVTTKLLRNAIMSIPDIGFDKNPTNRRNALLEKVQALDSQLAVGALRGALENLQNDFRSRLDEWLLDNYGVESPLQYTKTALLDLVDELIGRLAASAR